MSSPTVVRYEQTKNAVEIYTVDCTKDVSSRSTTVSTTASDHTTTYSGGGTVASSATVSGSKVSFSGIGPLTNVGQHEIELKVTYANGVKRGVLLLITVPPGAAT